MTGRLHKIILANILKQAMMIRGVVYYKTEKDVYEQGESGFSFDIRVFDFIIELLSRVRLS